ncbi:ABC transporter substrate-binding protein [Natronorubrum sp. JWXQ-INN-674]|uniref:ABC transporter substrate-binding protein n=1 Tax=Natronorubrum halalkaliphilum TaxID=2691917 RepID=A0A6B0VTZ5_9EURY|nr:ABC transporter substrate-binding protein [Natronorubrum halalkaliphilum]MXV64019.1 ABC transporter substrate-binding protein [Natronorubrum halalkaliphilum]
MNCDTNGPVDGVDRRSVLAAGAAGLSLSLSGCIDTVRSVVNDDGDDQLSLSIVTVPADGDRENVRIARHLESNLEAVGVDVTLTMRSRSEFLEKVLIDHDFDLYVGRHPADYDPDFLYEALHSTYADEAGWQNPFRYSNPTFFDPLLEEQRRAEGEERRARIDSVLDGLAEEKPFEPICRPGEYRVARTDRFDGWDDGHLATRRGYLGLDPLDEEIDRLDALVTDARPSQNVNPLSATARERGPIVDLLYDSLGTVHSSDDGEHEIAEWLAESWEWETPSDDEPGEKTIATVTLREDCTFHDGEPVTAADVAFTYRFIADTALGQADSPSPAPRYRGLTSLIDEHGIEIDDESDYRLRIPVEADRAVAERAFTVPILPRHIWREELRDRIDTAGDVTAPQGQWGLVTTSSVDPIGSGPYQFESQSDRDYLALERFDDHFTRREDLDGDHLLAPMVEELRFNVDPGSSSSIARVESGAADVTSSMLETHAINEISDEPEIQRLEDPSWTFYHLGFNTRVPPCSNPHFRRAVSQLIDKKWVVEEIFYDHAEPIATPVADEWVPDELAWDDDTSEDPVTPFVGTDGSLNVEAARAAFDAAGYASDSDGRLLGRY